jgi:hypothetical protein
MKRERGARSYKYDDDDGDEEEDEVDEEDAHIKYS